MAGKVYKLVVLGDAGVGKTALVLQLVTEHFDIEFRDPTIEDSYRKPVELKGQPCTLDILDTGGGYYKKFGSRWIGGGEGFVLVYSITSRESFQFIRELHSQIQKKEQSPSTRSPTEARKVPIMIVGNKSDKEKERAVSRPEGSALAKELGCMFSEVSARSQQDVKNVFVFYHPVRQFRWQRQQHRETSHGRGDLRLSTKSVGGSKRNCGYSAVRQFYTWLFS